MDISMNAEAERYLTHVEQIDHANGGVFGSSLEGMKLLRLLAESALAHGVEIARLTRLIGDTPYDVLSFVFTSPGKPDVAFLIRASELTARVTNEFGDPGDHEWKAERFMTELVRPQLEAKWGTLP